MAEPTPFDLWWSPSMKRLLTRHEDMDDEHLVWVVQGGHESLRHYLGTGLDSNPPMPDDAVQLVPDRDITSLEEELYNRAAAAETERDALRARIGTISETLARASGMMTTDSRDWSLSRSDVWLYGLIVAWECEEQHEHDEVMCGGDGALRKVAAQHGWADQDIARIRRFRAALQDDQS